jgi:hypothetical protein
MALLYAADSESLLWGAIGLRQDRHIGDFSGGSDGALQFRKTPSQTIRWDIVTIVGHTRLIAQDREIHVRKANEAGYLFA